MAGQNTLILATDYNLVQSKIASVMGEGSGTKGYGQNPLASSQVGQFSKITAKQWNDLRSDVLRARQHQTGQDLSSNLIVASANTTISEAQRAALLNMAIDTENPVDSDGNLIPVSPPPPTELARSNLFNELVRTQKWNGEISHTVDIIWPTANDARYFFNSGGNIEFSSSFSPSVSGLKGISWSTLLQNMGTFRFSWDRVYTTGSAFTGPGGFYKLTTIPVTIAQKETSSSAYVPNEYRITARVNSTLPNERRILTFVVYWDDRSGPPPSFPDPGFGVDEDVEGTLTSRVQVVRSINNVVIQVPNATTTAIG
jgi:hypothetical protein